MCLGIAHLEIGERVVFATGLTIAVVALTAAILILPPPCQDKGAVRPCESVSVEPEYFARSPRCGVFLILSAIVPGYCRRAALGVPFLIKRAGELSSNGGYRQEHVGEQPRLIFLAESSMG